MSVRARKNQSVHSSLSLFTLTLILYPEPESNRYSHFWLLDFKSSASTYSAIRAYFKDIKYLQRIIPELSSHFWRELIRLCLLRYRHPGVFQRYQIFLAYNSTIIFPFLAGAHQTLSASVPPSGRSVKEFQFYTNYKSRKKNPLRDFTLSEKRDSNPRPRPWQGRALPTELFSHINQSTIHNGNANLTHFFILQKQKTFFSKI